MFIDFSTGLRDGYPKGKFGRSLGGGSLYIYIYILFHNRNLQE